VCERERERETETEREKERERDRQRDRKTEKEQVRVGEEKSEWLFPSKDSCSLSVNLPNLLSPFSALHVIII
jgi:hypothetical protein